MRMRRAAHPPSRANAIRKLRDRQLNEQTRSRRRLKPIPLSIGVDVVCVADVAASIDRFGERYINRAYTKDEAAYCGAAAKPVAAARFAARFAAKEALIKALQYRGQWTDWRSIEVRRRSSGS